MIYFCFRNVTELSNSTYPIFNIEGMISLGIYHNVKCTLKLLISYYVLKSVSLLTIYSEAPLMNETIFFSLITYKNGLKYDLSM
jgi:hypothetical protein